MERERERVRTVPFGYAEEKTGETSRGTLIYYDTFSQPSEETLEAALGRAASFAVRRSFARLVLYPLHEETVKRMRGRPVEPYYKREQRLFDWREASGRGDVAIETWEGKRKKYTPMEAALRHLAESYPAPLFLYLSPETANAFASFSSFDEWIAKVRLVLAEPPATPHPKLSQQRHRWDVDGGDV